MPGSWSPHELPNLVPGSYAITSPATTRYNCIAWAANDDRKNWWPDPMDVGYWPADAPRSLTRGAFIKAYQSLGFEQCLNGALEVNLEKIVIYGIGQPGLEIPTHAALQLESGEWTSKLGPFEDICHKTLHAVNGPVYGKPICYMSRARSASR